MEELEIKVGMIIKYENISWRIISLVGDAVRMIEMDTSKTRIRTIQIEDILEYISNETMVVVKDTGDGVFDIDSLPKNERLRYEVKKSLVDRIRKMFGPSYAELERGIGLSLLTELCNEFSMSAATVYSIIRKWLQSGFQDTSLIGNKYIRKSDSVRKYKYVSKTGRPAAHKQGVVLDEVVLSYFEEGLKYFKRNRNATIKNVYRKILWRHYLTKTEAGWVLMPVDQIPTFRQFYNYVSTNMKEKDLIVRKKSEQEYNNDNREQRGTTYDMGLRPGSIVEVDALEADFMILSSLVDDQIVGRPIIYFMVDVFSHAIVAFSIGYDNNSCIAISNLMLNLVDDNDRYFERYGLDSMKGTLPFRFIPQEIRTDRGSDPLSHYYADVCNELRITLSHVRGGTGSMKGNVEQSFHQFHMNWAADLTHLGYMEKRYDSDHKSQACMKMNHVILMVTSFINYYNNRSMIDYNPPAEMIGRLNLKTPMEIWNVGTQTLGEPMPVSSANFAQVLNSLKFRETASISKAGINFKGLEYIPRQDDFELREIIRKAQRNAGKRNPDGSLKNSIPVRFDPRCIDTVSVMLDGRPHTCDLKVSTSGGLQGVSFMEYHDYQKCNDELNAKGERLNLDNGVAMAGFTEEVAKTIRLERSRNKPVQTGIREARRQEQFRSYAETAIDKRLDDAERPSLPPLKIEEPDNSVLPEETNLTKEDVAGNLEEPTEEPKNSEELKEDKTLEDLQEELLSLFYKGRRRD